MTSFDRRDTGSIYLRKLNTQILKNQPQITMNNMSSEIVQTFSKNLLNPYTNIHALHKPEFIIHIQNYEESQFLNRDFLSSAASSKFI